MIRAVLFDVGGPLDTEIQFEQLVDEHIREALAAEGIAVSLEDVTAASERAVANFAPNAYAAMTWDLSSSNYQVATRAFQRFTARSDERRAGRGGFEMRPGMPEVLQQLRADGLLLGLAANQPLAVIEQLDRFGIGEFFSHREVSGHHGYRKPDIRLFLRACEDLGVEPRECIMVGDRIDNDIFPATVLGMSTVLFRTGRHIRQQARSWDELPSSVCDGPASLLAAIRAIREAHALI